jgi:hypothetical protein
MLTQTTPHCTTLHCTALHYTTLHYTTPQYTMLHCTTAHRTYRVLRPGQQSQSQQCQDHPVIHTNIHTLENDIKVVSNCVEVGHIVRLYNISHHITSCYAKSNHITSLHIT